MLRATVTKATISRPVSLVSRAAFTTTARTMSAGDTGSPPKTGGQGDAFQRRERANEEYAIRQREKEKLLEMRKKITEQQAHLEQLANHIDEITKDQGGEKN